MLPLINKVGVAWTDTIFAALAWVSYGCVRHLTLTFSEVPRSFMTCRMILFTIKYGDRMRAWVDIGYSTIRDN